MFSTQSDNCTLFVHIFDIIFLFAAVLEEPKIGIPGEGLKELQECMARCTDHHDITEILLKMALKAYNQSIDQSVVYPLPTPPPPSLSSSIKAEQYKTNQCAFRFTRLGNFLFLNQCEINVFTSNSFTQGFN